MDKTEKFILASASPRRKELFSFINEAFECVPADIDETVDENIPLLQAPEDLACRKARHIAAIYPNAIVVGCDTAVFINGKMLGKPENEADAYRMLSDLSGNTHSVITGCCICANGMERSFSEETEVIFFKLSDKEIKDYIASGEPMDKAGAYGIQGRGRLFVKGINGDFYNVVGLPVARLAREIADMTAE